MSTLTTRESVQITAANESGRQPVVLVHGLWLLAGSWDLWRSHLERSGYAPVVVDWPGEPADFDAARIDSSALIGTSVVDLADHVAEVASALTAKPILIGHSFGGLIVQIVAGRGLAAATVSIDPAPSKGVLPLPYSALKSSFPVLKNPANRARNVTLTFDEFRYGFANAIAESEARELYDHFHVPGPGLPLFEAAFANVSTSKATYADKKNPDRGPMLVVSGTADHIAPPVLARAAYKKQSSNASPTEFVQIPDAGHSLVIDNRWQEVADASLAFVRSHLG